MYKLAVIALWALLSTGCQGQLLVAGNMVFMGIACLMLWSTVNLKTRQE